MNNAVDKLVKETLAEHIVPLNYDNSKYNYILHNNNTLIKVYYRLMDKIHNDQHPSKRSSITQLNNIPYTNEIINESRFLDYYDSQLLAQLRMGYMHSISDDIFEQPICACDENAALTVQHFLIECKKDGLIDRRKDLKQNLIAIDEKYNEKLQYLLDPNATNDQKMDMVKLLLFPHLDYTTTQLNNFNTKLIKMYILRLILYYCRHRFPD